MRMGLGLLLPSRRSNATRRPDGLLRRHDYVVDVLGGAMGAHYIDDYRDHSGILMPHRRRVYPLGADKPESHGARADRDRYSPPRLRIGVSDCLEGGPDESRDPR
jgi:hypothetical protein